MTQIRPESVFRRVWQVSHDLPEEGQVAFFDEGRSELVVVNSVGGAVWQLLDGERTVRDIAELLASEVQGAPPPDSVFETVVTFLNQLEGRGSIQEVSRPPSAS